MMEAARTSATLVNFYQTTQCYNPEDSHLLFFHLNCWKYIQNSKIESISVTFVSIYLCNNCDDYEKHRNSVILEVFGNRFHQHDLETMTGNIPVF
jgi:hypothetical protein